MKYKKLKLVMTITLTVVLIFIIPFIIEQCYLPHGIIAKKMYRWMNGRSFLTQYDAKDILNYIASILTFIGTITLGFIAISQSNRANNISDKLMQLEFTKNRPIIDFEYVYCNEINKPFIDFLGKEKNIIRTYFKNVGFGVIKKVKLDKANFYIHNNKYQLKNEKTEKYNTDRAVMIGDRFHLHTEFEKCEHFENNELEEMNKLFEETSGGTFNGVPFVEGLYVLELFFIIEGLDGQKYRQSTWCLFREVYENQLPKYNMYNRVIKFLD